MSEQAACFVHPSATVKNITAKSSARIFQNVFIADCELGEDVTIGDFTRIEGSKLSDRVQIQRNNMIYSAELGRCTYTGKNTTLWHCKLGAFCSLSWNVSIGGANHDYSRVTTHSFLYSDSFGLLPENESCYDRFASVCTIGNDVWIAANACICRNVRIGDGAVVGAGAVVTKDVEPYTIVAGVPAKPIKKRFKQEYIDRLQKTRWWDLPFEVIKAQYRLFNAQPDDNNLYALEKICYAYFSKEV